MAYDGKVLRRAAARYDEEKQRHEEEFRARRRRCYAEAPRLEEIDTELSHTMAKIVATGFRRGVDPQTSIAELREENLGLQRERGEILTSLGHPADYLEPKPICSKCGGSGWEGSRMCSCLKKIYIREQNAELSQMLDLGNQSFDTFDIEYYSPTDTFGRKKTAQENMDDNREKCSYFARHFPSKYKNLLLTGEPGLGKTHLSASIARAVSESGFSVVYDTAAHVFSRFETQKFSRGDEGDDAGDDVSRYLKCDLLILDDLGTEMTTSFTQSALYDLVNTRLMAQRSTVISTNLNPSELAGRYGDAIYSRIRGEYEILPFYGEDIRKLKRK